MDTKISTNDDTTIIELSGRLDSNSAPSFEKQLNTYLASPEGNLVFDFNDLDYISSAGLRVVLNTAKAYREAPFSFITCSMQDHVLEVFEIAGFDTIIDIKPTVGETLLSLNSKN